MCGIAGFYSTAKNRRPGEHGVILSSMASALRHRGPDDEGLWEDREAGVGLAHRRLAILDLSQEGHQPMVSACGRYVIVFNGEIYNFADLRASLESEGAAAWRGTSDTEVMLAAISRHGVRAAVETFSGMFAFAVWDRAERTLTLARDRMGEKPLYYGWSGGTFLFGSELKALRAHPDCDREISREAVGLFLRYGYIPCPHSIHRHIRKLPPGTMLRLACHGERVEPELTAYWSLRASVLEGQDTPFAGSDEEAVRELEGLLSDSVRRQMVADVPLGAFLSGGIDSSLIVALMQSHSLRPVKTFSIGFHESGFNEAHHAKAVAAHLGTDHTELYVSAAEAMAAIPTLARTYDEPFSDPSQIPTYLVAQLARRHVTVSLSGDGGDELFGGYVRYTMATDLWRRLRPLPAGARALLLRLVEALPTRLVSAGAGCLAPVLPAWARQSNLADKLLKGAELLRAESLPDLYGRLVSHWKEVDRVVPGFTGARLWAEDPANAVDGLEAVPWMMLNDALTYLPDDILVKVDRASMAVSLESRIPLLDHRVVEFSWRLPLHLKVRQGQGKWILRRVLDGHVPRELIDRPKTGFGVPIDAWLRGPLQAWAGDLLNESVMRRQGLLDPEPVLRKWKEHRSGRRSWHYQLWNVLMLQDWLASQDRPGSPDGRAW